jgi:Flp pilus assembly protein TadD
MKKLALALMAASAMGACATTGGAEEGPMATAAREHNARIDRDARQRVGREDTLTQMAFWAGEYATFPDDLESAQRFAEALRKGGRADRAAQIAMEAVQRFPEDRALLMTLGLAQIAANHPQEALRPLALLAASDPQDWRARSALGVALDQVGRFEEARRAYQEALAIQPGDAGVLTNMGVSHLLAGETEQAETILRQASELPGAPVQARQNLAIALALQGRFDEAEQLERIDLPPAVVAENMEYLRGLLTDDRRWGDMQTSRNSSTSSR